MPPIKDDLVGRRFSFVIDSKKYRGKIVGKSGTHYLCRVTTAGLNGIQLVSHKQMQDMNFNFSELRKKTAAD